MPIFFRQVDGMDGAIDGFDGYPPSQTSPVIDYRYLLYMQKHE